MLHWSIEAYDPANPDGHQWNPSQAYGSIDSTGNKLASDSCLRKEIQE